MHSVASTGYTRAMSIRDYVLRVRLNAQERKALEKLAKDQGLSVAESVREWVRSLIKGKREESR